MLFRGKISHSRPCAKRKKRPDINIFLDICLPYYSLLLDVNLLVLCFCFDYSECEKNISCLRRLDCVPKLLYILQDGKPPDATLQTIASVMSVLLNKSNRDADLLRFLFYIFTLFLSYVLKTV